MIKYVIKLVINLEIKKKLYRKEKIIIQIT